MAFHGENQCLTPWYYSTKRNYGIFPYLLNLEIRITERE